MYPKASAWIVLCLAAAGLFPAGSPAGAGGADPALRCGTGLRFERAERFAPLRPAGRRGVARQAVPVPVEGATALVSGHFRVLWGDRFDASDAHWSDGDGNGVPLWASALGQALESALALLRALGFPDPYGLEGYYLDAYVGNTGLRVGGTEVSIGSSYYAYTDVDPEHGAAYFVFGADYSAHAADELGVLRAAAVHELFHAVQRSWYPWDDTVRVPDSRWAREGWWFEATATWLEELFAPGVDDYVPFVRGFLAAPHLALAHMDGRREYGAALFPGYLRLRWDGSGREGGIWTEVFAGAFAGGLEPALEAALARRGSGLAEAVAEFWSLAAHPEDFWPGGDRYRSETAPRFLASVTGLPAEPGAAGALAPGRLGASLVRIRDMPADLTADLRGASTASRWVLGVSGSGEDRAETVDLGRGGETRLLRASGAGETFLAVVNASAGEEAEAFRLELAGLASSPEEGRDPGAAGGGGCFLRAAGR